MLILNTILNKRIRLRPEIIYAPSNDPIYLQNPLWYIAWEFEEGTDEERYWFDTVFKGKNIIDVTNMFNNLENRVNQNILYSPSYSTTGAVEEAT